MTEVSRRTVLAGVAATAATAAFGNITVPLSALAQAKPEDDRTSKDLPTFVGLSEKLTGIPASKLAPGVLTPGVDAVGVASIYLNEASKKDGFNLVLQAFKATPTIETVANLMKDPQTMYLCRSIILAWYLGAWYEPETLNAEANQSEKAIANKREAATGKPPAKRYNLVRCRVISPKTYTQGWVWRIAQAHPMGYANLQFGYWNEKPPKDDFISVREVDHAT